MARKSRNISGGYKAPKGRGSSDAIPSSKEVHDGAEASSTATLSTQFASFKPRGRLTHFLCLPLAHTEESRTKWRSSLARFEEMAQQLLKGSDQVPAGSVRPPGTMHLTLGVMSLSEEQVDEALALLPGAVRKAWNATADISSSAKASAPSEPDAPRVEPSESVKLLEQPLVVKLESVIPMTRPKTSVLFAEPTDSTDRLRPFCEALRKELATSGFLQHADRDLKLHATVLNTIYGRRVGYGRPHPAKIDPTVLLAACEEFEWLEVVIDKVAICKMGAQSVLNEEGEKVDEVYTVVKEVGLSNA